MLHRCALPRVEARDRRGSRRRRSARDPELRPHRVDARLHALALPRHLDVGGADRKSTRLNSSHTVISYAVFCLKKKKTLSSAKNHVIHIPRLNTDIKQILCKDRIYGLDTGDYEPTSDLHALI